MSSGLTNPLKLDDLVRNGVKYLTVDRTLSTGDMQRIATRFRSLNPDTVDMMTLPTRPITDSNGNYGGEQLVEPQAQQLIDRINGIKAPATRPATQPASAIQPAEVRIRVLNGTGEPGLATRSSDDLTAAGFAVAGRFPETPIASPMHTPSCATRRTPEPRLISCGLDCRRPLRSSPTQPCATSMSAC